MNFLDSKELKSANKCAVYCLFASLQDKIDAKIGEPLYKAVEQFKSKSLSINENKELALLTAGMSTFSLENSRLFSQIKSKNGLNASAFREEDGSIIVVFASTGKGEWIDNGEGLSGIPEKNTYLSFNSDGKVIGRKIVNVDFATDQQVRALNWFNKISKNYEYITVTGHSKGGNNAQFITINSPLVSRCYSFDGQGFSPEAVNDFKKLRNYKNQRNKILSFCAEDDYVNVLGKQLVYPNNIFYFKTNELNPVNIHRLYAILNNDGTLTKQTEQGELSEYMQTVSQKLMSLKPSVRKYATLGVMNLFQNYVGKVNPVNNDKVSVSETIAGVAIAIGIFLDNFPK